MDGRILAALALAGASLALAEPALSQAGGDPLKAPSVLRIREAFKVDGIALFDAHSEHAARMGVCAPSIFAGLKWCVSGTAEEKRGAAAYLKTTGYNTDAEGRIVYVVSIRRSYPLKRNEFETVIQAIGERFGAGAAVYALRKSGEETGDVNSLVAVWGGLRLVHLTEAEYAVVETGGSLKRGHLVDHRFSLVASAKQRDPIYKIEGETGFILHLMVTSPDRADVIARAVYQPVFLPAPPEPTSAPAHPLVIDSVRRPRTPAGDAAAAEESAKRAEAERALAAERLLRAEAERGAAQEKAVRAEAERKSAAERRALDEQKARAEAERRAAEERAKRAEAELKAVEERHQKEAAERKAAEERARRAERARMSSEERRRHEQAERKAAEERAQRAEAERKALEERRRKEEAERKAAQEAARRAEAKHADAERKALEERRRKDEAERKAAEERRAAEKATKDRADAERAERRRAEAAERAAEEGRKSADERASAERRAESERSVRAPAERPESWYRMAADSAKKSGAIWSFAETQDRLAEERTLRSQTIFGGADRLAIEVTFECTIGRGRRLRAVARGFDRKSGASVAFRTEGEGTFGVRTRFRLDDQPPQDGFLFRERQDDLASILEVPVTSADLGRKTPRAGIWLRHYEANVEFNLVAGTVPAVITPYADNLRRVLEACAK